MISAWDSYEDFEEFMYFNKGFAKLGLTPSVMEVSLRYRYTQSAEKLELLHDQSHKKCWT